MAYAILRIKKLRTIGSVAAAGSHLHRKRHTPNADPSKGIKVLDGSYDLCKDIETRLPKKRRVSAVLAVEMLLTASPEWFRDGGNVESWSLPGDYRPNECSWGYFKTPVMSVNRHDATSKNRLTCEEIVQASTSCRSVV